MFYLPRLYIYHTEAAYNSELDKTLRVMEYRLFKFIMNPSMITTYIFGLLNAYIYGFIALGRWFHIKMLAVLGMTVIHGLLGRWRKDFANGRNRHSAKFYRIINEIPPLLMIVAVIMVVVKPFE